LSDDYKIVANPSLRHVTPGAKIDYSLTAVPGGPALTEAGFVQWFAVNDPSTVGLFKFNTVPGPGGLAWIGATWSFPGHHRIVASVTRAGTTKAITYEQWVIPLEQELATLGKLDVPKIGPALPRSPHDPDAALSGVRRQIEVILKVAQKKPPVDDNAKKDFEKFIKGLEDYRDKLAERLTEVNGIVKHPIAAEHFDAATQKTSTLRVFIARVAFDKWLLIDWTNPVVRSATGVYEGFGQTDEEAIRNALKDWDSDNRYPNGVIRYKTPAVFNVPEIEDKFDTDGSAFWDSVSSFFGWIGLGAAVVAGVVTMVAPVPGSQVVSALIWTSIFSSSAAAVINIGTRVDEGFSSWSANAFDVLTIVGNLFGATGALWSRGANALIKVGDKTAKFAIYGSIATTGIQGVMISVDLADEIDQIMADPNLTPQERTNRLVAVLSRGLASGVLLYATVRSSKTDLANLNKTSLSGGATPAERVGRLGAAKESVDLTKPPKVSGKASKDPHVTKVQTAQEAEVPHAGGSTGVQRPRPAMPPPKGPQTSQDLDQLLRDAAGAKPELDKLTREVAAEVGGEPLIPGLKTRERALEKVKGEYGGDPSRLTDLARSTVVFKRVKEVRAAIDAVKARAKNIVRLKDRFTNPTPSGYRDVNITFRASNGHVVEIQLHLEGIEKAKSGPGHKLYEEVQKIERAAAAQGRDVEHLTADEVRQIAKLNAEEKKLYDAAMKAAGEE
jgi:hypothetical protein